MRVELYSLLYRHIEQIRVVWLDEKKLIDGLKKKKVWAYEVLYDEYASRLGSVVKSYLGYDDVEDVIQEVL